MAVEQLHYTPDDPFGLHHPVHILDDIRVQPGQQAAFHRLMEDHYLSLARERKMELAGVWFFPPFETADRPTDIVYLWRYATLKDWWDARISEENDARLPAFWARAADLVQTRTRRLGRAPALMLGTEPDRASLRLLPALDGTRRIAFVRPRDPLTPADEAAWVAAAGALAGEHGVRVSRAGFHVEFSFLPGHMTWDLVSEPGQPIPRETLLSALPGPAEIVEWVELEAPIDFGKREPIGPVRQKRTILLRIGDAVSEAHREELEDVLRGWVRQLEGLRAWSLSRIAGSEGSLAWTHCFEQEFVDLSVITKDYLEHPYHWAIADRYFGPEGQEKAVYEFVHTIRATDASMFDPTTGPTTGPSDT